MHASSEFGPWLRQLRTDHDLTQERLADVVGCAPETIRSFESGRRRPSQALALRLAQVLGLSSSESERFVAVARKTQNAAPAATPGAAGEERSAVRQATIPLALLPGDALIGRHPELERLQQALLIERRRLVTLLGSGGVGKTRLALQTAVNLGSAFTDGVVFVGLAPISESAQAASAIAAAVGCVPAPGEQVADALVVFLAERQLLLVLDNLEQLLMPTQAATLVELVVRLVRETQGVQLLITSRERLQLQDELVLEVGGLGLPADESVDAITRSDAVLLFVERAGRIGSAFALSPATRVVVAQICRRLEGIPLAIELAAAQTPFLPLPILLQRLDQALAVLEGGARDLPERQRTMRATIDWSYNLLEPGERTLFQRLAVFVGGFSLEAAEAVGAAEPIKAAQCLRLLSSLVNRSLVLRDARAEGVARYRLLEPVRQYALECLCADELEATAARNRHAAFFAALARATEPLLRTTAQVSQVEQLELEYANFGAVITWLLGSGAAALAANIGRDLWLFLWMRGHFRDGQRWMAEALAQLPHTPSLGRANALLVLSVLAYGQGDYQQAAPLAEQALAAFEAIEDALGRAESLSMVGMNAAALKNYARAETYLEQAVSAQLAVGNRWAAAMTLTYWAPIPLNHGAYRRAAALAEQARELARELGDRIGEYSAAYNLALVAQAEGNPTAAQQLFSEALALAVELGDAGNIVACLKGLGGVAVAQNRFERAAQLWGAAEALSERTEIAQYTYSLDQTLYRTMLEQARAELPAEVWAAAWNAGRALPQQQAVAYALGPDHEQPD
jgi:predicted ATPase/DNA-binding XRE family transcriptional regulator